MPHNYINVESYRSLKTYSKNDFGAICKLNNSWDKMNLNLQT